MFLQECVTERRDRGRAKYITDEDDDDVDDEDDSNNVDDVDVDRSSASNRDKTQAFGSSADFFIKQHNSLDVVTVAIIIVIMEITWSKVFLIALLGTSGVLAQDSEDETTTYRSQTTTREHITTTTTTTEPPTATTTESTTTTTPTAETTTPENNGEGQVAFMVGNIRTSDEVEVFSPDGGCTHRLANLPIAILPNPILFMYHDKIVSCADIIYPYYDTDSNCFTYKPDTNTWAQFRTNKTWENYKRFGKPAVLYDNILFIIDDYKPEAFDPETLAWTYWPKPINSTSVGACMIRADKSLVLIGGLQMDRSAQKYDIDNQTWSVLAPPPMNVEYSGCTLLPNGKILVLGSSFGDFRRQAALYDIEANTWASLGGTKFDRFGTSLVTIGKRVFAIGGGFDPDVQVEEYNYDNDTWIRLDAKPNIHRMKHNTMAVPASLFAHLPGGCVGVGV